MSVRAHAAGGVGFRAHLDNAGISPNPEPFTPLPLKVLVAKDCASLQLSARDTTELEV